MKINTKKQYTYNIMILKGAGKVAIINDLEQLLIKLKQFEKGVAEMHKITDKQL